MPTCVACADVTESFRAVSSPVRAEIVRRPTAGERTVGALVDALGPARQLVPHPLRTPRSAHLVRPVRRGRDAAHSLTDDHVAHHLGAHHHTQESSP